MSETEAKQESGAARSFALFVVVLAFFFISGGCGLLYQVVWTRKLVLLFGTTSYAVSTVLSIFFLGLGVGSLWGGRLADRSRRPLFVYGVFEIVIGVWALGFILTVSYGEGAVVAILKAFSFSRGVGIGLRAVMAALLLFVPVALMGATLPLLAKFVNARGRVHGFRIGTLYSVNTFGAVTGCFLTGFVLIQALGYFYTTLVGAAANIGIGVLALLLSRRSTVSEGPQEIGAAAAEEDAEAMTDPIKLVLVAFFISGFSALALEVLWTRLLTIIFLGTTYAYTAMLGTLLCGIALGSGVASLLVDRVRSRVGSLGLVLFAAGIATIFKLGYLAGMPEKILDLQRGSGGDWDAVIRGKVWSSFVALFLPTFFFGMTFPFVVKIVGGGRHRLGRDIGVLYSVNTFGGVLGAAAGGYLMIPLLGTHLGIVVLALLLSAMGAALILRSPDAPNLRKTLIGVGIGIFTIAWWPTIEVGYKIHPLLGPPLGILVLALLLVVMRGALILVCSNVRGADRAVYLGIGVLLLACAWWRAPVDVNASLNAGYIPKDHRVISYREGVEGTVAVSEPAGVDDGSDRVLWINRVQATTSIEKGVKMNRLQGVLPLLFDRDPQEVLFMCFGSGITCGTLALSDFSHIDAVEISQDVLDLAPLFSVDNLGVIDDAKVEFHIDDGRNFLLTTDKLYDVITFEPMPLALAGVSTFYTQEYYELCLAHLAPGGIVSQWVPLHSLTPEVVRALVRTFTSVFPEYNAWFINADLFLVGSNAPLRVDYAGVERRLASPVLMKALAKVGLPDVAEILGCFLMDKSGLDAYTVGAALMTDDRPWAEFVAPKLVYERQVPAAIVALQPHVGALESIILEEGIDAETLARLARRHRARVNDLEGVRRYYGMVMMDPDVADSFLESLAIDPDDFNAQFYLGRLAEQFGAYWVRGEEFGEAVALLGETVRYVRGNAALYLLLGDAYVGLGDAGAAREAYEKYLALGGDAARARAAVR